MPGYVDADPGPAQAGGDRLELLGRGLTGRPVAPPAVTWGEDKFGAALQAAYPEDLAEACRTNRDQLGEQLSRAGTGVRTTMSDYLRQDRQSAGELGSIPVPGGGP